MGSCVARTQFVYGSDHFPNTTRPVTDCNRTCTTRERYLPRLMGSNNIRSWGDCWSLDRQTTGKAHNRMGGEFPILDRFFSHNKVDKVERLFKRYGIWTILIAAFTPLPYKVFAITAGILQMDRRSFIIASIIGRSARFLTIGVLIALFGQEIESIMSNNFELITVSIAAITIIGVMGWIWFKRTHRRTSSTLR